MATRVQGVTCNGIRLSPSFKLASSLEDSEKASEAAVAAPETRLGALQRIICCRTVSGPSGRCESHLCIPAVAGGSENWDHASSIALKPVHLIAPSPVAATTGGNKQM